MALRTSCHVVLPHGALAREAGPAVAAFAQSAACCAGCVCAGAEARARGLAPALTERRTPGPRAAPPLQALPTATPASSAAGEVSSGANLTRLRARTLGAPLAAPAFAAAPRLMLAAACEPWRAAGFEARACLGAAAVAPADIVAAQLIGTRCKRG